MGDFEDVFGAGANAETIINNFDRDFDDDAQYKYSSGERIPRTPNFPELTGDVGLLPPNVFEKLDRCKRELFEEEARKLSIAFDGARQIPFRFSSPAIASRHFLSTIRRCCQTVAEREAFLVMVTSGAAESVLIRGIRDGSTHAIVFPEGFYMTSHGMSDMEGWFTDDALIERFPSDNGLPGHEVLAVSAELSGKPFQRYDWHRVMLTYSEDAQKWVASHRRLREEAASPFSYVSRSDLRQRRLRTWSDKQEQNLRLLVQRLAAAILPVQTSCAISLYAEATFARINAHLYDNRVTSPRKAAFAAALKTLIDLSSFRGRIGSREFGFQIELLNGESDARSIEDMLTGREVLLDVAEQKGFDRAPVQAAMVREDWNQLAIILDPK